MAAKTTISGIWANPYLTLIGLDVTESIILSYNLPLKAISYCSQSEGVLKAKKLQGKK